MAYDQNAAWRAYYERNKKKVLDRNARRRNENRVQLRDLKERTPCVDCGKKYPAPCMEFDHRDPATKKGTISYLLSGSWGAILREIDKCDMRCANCHRIRHFNERNNPSG